MATSMLCHAWGLHSYRFVSTCLQVGNDILPGTISHIVPLYLLYLLWLARKVIRAGQVLQKFRTVPI